MATYVPPFASPREDHFTVHKPKTPLTHWSADPFLHFGHHEPKLSASHGGKDTIAPSFQIRESREAYFLEGEFTGVQKQEDIQVRWTGSRTLEVEAHVHDIDLEKEWGVVLSTSPADPLAPRTLRHWINERHIGHFFRSFTFPDDVRHDTLKARFEQGLLKMMVLKKEPMKAPRQVQIEFGSG